LVLGGALNQKNADGQQTSAPPQPASHDPQALLPLDRAIDALAPERVGLLEATVWQQARSEDFSYQACGRLLTAPGDRSRFELNVRVGTTQAELRMVCDGKTLWQSTRAGNDKSTVCTWDLPAAKDGTAANPELAQARAKFLEEQGFPGLSACLRRLRQGLQNAQCEQQRWNGREVFVISGTWPDNAAQFAGVADIARPRYQARLCRLFLDAQTFWPHRLEWWGSEKPNQANLLLAQTEFRDPVFHRSLAPEQFTALFAVK
jgi:hypothetical protein